MVAIQPNTDRVRTKTVLEELKQQKRRTPAGFPQAWRGRGSEYGDESSRPLSVGGNLVISDFTASGDLDFPGHC